MLTTDSINTNLVLMYRVRGEFDIHFNTFEFSNEINHEFQNSRIDGGELNHAVVVVGYLTIPGTSQRGFLVRNSYGVRWGDAGYIWIADNDRVCGLCSSFVYI